MSVTGSATSSDLKVLKGKISSLAPYALDKTLAVDGSAADSKAVGDALKKKVSYTDIVDNLTTSDPNLPLSANMGNALRFDIQGVAQSLTTLYNNTSTIARTAQETANSAKTAAEDAYAYASSVQENSDTKMALDGSAAMEGDLDMDDHAIVNVAEPVDDTDAANKQYVDSKRQIFQVILSASSWATTTGEAPFYQEVDIEEITATDTPHYCVVYSETTSTALAQKEAFALVDDLETFDGSVRFTCFEKKPEVKLTINLEVNR